MNEFHKDKTRKDGIRGICKICVNTQIEYSKFRKEQKKKLLKKRIGKREMSKKALEILETVEWGLNGACYICKGLEPKHFSDCALKRAITLLKQQPKTLNFAIKCGAMGKGDDSCCGCIYWSFDGRLLCNECGTEYHLVEQQPPTGEWTKKVRDFIKLYENEVPRRAEITFLIEACDRLDRAESINADLLATCKEFMLLADNGSAAFDDPLPDSPYLKAEAAIAKAEKEG